MAENILFCLLVGQTLRDYQKESTAIIGLPKKMCIVCTSLKFLSEEDKVHEKNHSGKSGN